MRAPRKRLIAVLKMARSAIQDELDASGEDEIRDQPILRWHEQVWKKIDKVLKAEEAAELPLDNRKAT